MTLYMIGLGLFDLADITLRGLEIIKRCESIYLDNYTAVLHTPKEELEELFGKEVTYATRECVELGGNDIVDEAKTKDVAFLVVGDPFGATTHTDLFLRARQKKVHIEVVHNASILSAVGVVGLELYKYGRVASLVFPDHNYIPTSPLDIIRSNLAINLHTLLLLDIKVAEPTKEDLRRGNAIPQPPRFMTVNQGLEAIEQMEKKAGITIIPKDKIIVGVARLGAMYNEPIILSGTIDELKAQDFGKPMHSIIIPANTLHDMEQDMIEQWRV